MGELSWGELSGKGGGGEGVIVWVEIVRVGVDWSPLLTGRWYHLSQCVGVVTIICVQVVRMIQKGIKA